MSRGSPGRNELDLKNHERSHRPVRPLACPARFERATYALEALKMS